MYIYTCVCIYIYIYIHSYLSWGMTAGMAAIWRVAPPKTVPSEPFGHVRTRDFRTDDSRIAYNTYRHQIA